MSTPLRIVHVSDSHLGVDVPYADEHWDAVVAHVAATRPDLVVHTGDVSRDGAGMPADLAHSRDRLGELPVPWLALAGNHDIGDSDDDEHPVDDERRRRWHELFGALRWSHERAGWRLVGIDIQTLHDVVGGSRRALGLVGAGARHGATDRAVPAPPAAPVGRRVRRAAALRRRAAPARARRDLVAAGDVRLVASGHVHQHLVTTHEGVAHVWAPSSWAVIPDEVQPVIAAKQTGIIELALHADGAVDAAYVRPAGMVDAVIGVDVPVPVRPTDAGRVVDERALDDRVQAAAVRRLRRSPRTRRLLKHVPPHPAAGIRLAGDLPSGTPSSDAGERTVPVQSTCMDERAVGELLDRSRSCRSRPRCTDSMSRSSAG